MPKKLFKAKKMKLGKILKVPAGGLFAPKLRKLKKHFR